MKSRVVYVDEAEADEERRRRNEGRGNVLVMLVVCSVARVRCLATRRPWLVFFFLLLGLGQVVQRLAVDVAPAQMMKAATEDQHSQ